MWQTKNTTASAITLTGLYPGREYVVRVRCIPWHDDKDRTVGFWSNTTRIRVKTKDTGESSHGEYINRVWAGADRCRFLKLYSVSLTKLILLAHK